MQILLSRAQAVPGRTDKQEQEQTSLNHLHAFKPISVLFQKRTKNPESPNLPHSGLVEWLTENAPSLVLNVNWSHTLLP